MRRIAALLLALAAGPAAALVSITGNVNTSAPADDPGWANVGMFSNGEYTLVYLGGGWVLSAAHLVALPPAKTGSDVILGGVTYEWDHVPREWMQTPPNVPYEPEGQGVDLALWRIVGDPGLPSIPIASTSPAAGTEVVIVSNAQGRGAAYGPDGNGYHGWYRDSGARIKLWGTNKVRAAVPPYEGHGSYYTVFDHDPANQTADEAQACGGDSGAVVFMKENGVWVVSGIVVSGRFLVSLSTAVFGNETTIKDVGFYSRQINRIMGHGAYNAPWLR